MARRSWAPTTSPVWPQVLELLHLLNANKDWSHPNLEIVVTVGEEQGLNGSRALDKSKLKAKWGLVYDAAGGVGAITYWAPTSVFMTVTVHGKKVHAGVEPEKGINAIQVAAEAIANMPLGRIDEETVANIGTIEGGEARNIVPGEVQMLGMARSHDQSKLDAQIAAMRKAFEDAAAKHGATVDFEAEEKYRTYKIEPSERPYREAVRALESLGIEVIHRKSGGGTDGNVFNNAGIRCVAMCTGMVDEHAATEHISIDGPGDRGEGPGHSRHAGTGSLIRPRRAESWRGEHDRRCRTVYSSSSSHSSSSSSWACARVVSALVSGVA